MAPSDLPAKGAFRAGFDLVCCAGHRPMHDETGQTLHYQRARFATQLPVAYRYSPSHAWLVEMGRGVWRVGLTKFATRQLGELVEHGFEVKPGDAVRPGQVIGWVEGFKAISDLVCVVSGRFVGSNPALKEQITLLNRDPHGAGWLYEVEGTPDPKCLDVHAYAALLDQTIDRLMERRPPDGSDERPSLI